MQDYGDIALGRHPDPRMGSLQSFSLGCWMCPQPGPWALQLCPPESLRHAGHVPGLPPWGCSPRGTWCGKVRCFSSYIALRGRICWALSALPAGPAASASCWRWDEEPVPPFCPVVPLEGGGLRSLVLWLHAGTLEYSYSPAVGRLLCGLPHRYFPILCTSAACDHWALQLPYICGTLRERLEFVPD